MFQDHAARSAELDNRLQDANIDDINRSQALMDQKMTEKFDQIMLQKDDLKNRLIAAERTSAAAKEEVAALTSERWNKWTEGCFESETRYNHEGFWSWGWRWDVHQFDEDDNERDRLNDETDTVKVEA